jgi:hypothetical protein
MENFNAGHAPGKWKPTSGMKTPGQQVKLPVAPELGHNST